tara:strand:+ start:8499 stop:9338 length:840 start_codon:yes stop_codon:yes gene_type:complete
MKKIILKSLWHIARYLRIHAINRNLAFQNYFNILSENKKKNNKILLNYGYKNFSQADEDGILEEIFKRIGTVNKTFIEIGVQDGYECNTLHLINQKWNGIWIEKEKKYCEKIYKNFNFLINKYLEVINDEADTENINDLVQNNINNQNDIDLLSIDIGLNTYHVLKKINSISPRVIIVEYNAKFGPSAEWIIKYDKNAEWDNSNYFGASLKSFEIMLKEKNYLLVGCNVTGVNAFFVRKDLVNEKFIDDYSSEYHYQNKKEFLLKAFENENKVKIGRFE